MTIYNCICTLPEEIQNAFVADIRKLSYPYTNDEIQNMLNQKLVNMLSLTEEAVEAGLTIERYTAMLNAYNWQ